MAREQVLPQDPSFLTYEDRNVPQTTGIHSSAGGIHSVVGRIHSSSVHQGETQPQIAGIHSSHWNPQHSEICPCYLPRELGTQFPPKGPKTRGIRGNNDSVGGNRGQLRKNASQIQGIRGNSWNREQHETLPES
ncbi:hypothetical protein R3P38DRAFT_2784795 [Favolaschia claudopus]|uniref:Uncharacterized protein n=1 Tax=Favolaschia claudopus TaxID=2862362 RepID=A0AAW0AXC6_9AGAR